MNATRNLRWLLAATGLFAAAACIGPGGAAFDPGDDIDETRYGAIEVSVITTGATPDPDGYVVGLDESTELLVATNGGVTFSPVAQGYYSVRLSGVEGNCSIPGTHPASVYVFADTTQTVHFDVECP